MTVSVLICDDQAMIRAGLRMILDADLGLQVVAEAGDGAEAVAAAARLEPDVVLMDIQMPRMDGLEATRQICRGAALRSRVLVLTTFERDDYIFAALRAGASGFMIKNAPPEELLNAVHVVATGDAILSPSVTRRIVEDYARRPAPAGPPATGAAAQLTQREREVLALLSLGRSNLEIAQSLFVGEGTVKTHVSNLLAKLGLRDRVQAVVYAYESGLVTRGST